MLVDPSISHTLRPIIQGQEDIITRITWKCNIVTSAAPCPDFDAPETDFETTRIVPGDSYLPSDSIIRFIMSLEAKNSDGNVEDLASCSIDLHTPDSTKN